MKKIAFIAFLLVLTAQSAFACPLHDGDGGKGKEAAGHSE